MNIRIKVYMYVKIWINIGNHCNVNHCSEYWNEYEYYTSYDCQCTINMSTNVRK